MTEVFKRLAEWNPKKGDVFKSRSDSIVRMVTDDEAQYDSRVIEGVTDKIEDFTGKYTLVSRATLEEPPVGKWIGWNGGKCPVHPKTVVNVVCFSNGVHYGSGKDQEAVLVYWGENSDVVAYRVVDEYKEPREYWVFTNGHGDLCVSATWRRDSIHVKEVE